MNIQSIQNYHTFNMKQKLSKRETAVKNVSTENSVKDTYKPAESGDRSKLLASVKKKIKSGYYKSNEVVEDLSETFAKIFDKTL